MNSSFDLQSYFSKSNKSTEFHNLDASFHIEVIFPGSEKFVQSNLLVKDFRIILMNDSSRKVIYIIESILYYLVEREDCIMISICFCEKYYILKFSNKKDFDLIFPKIFSLIRRRNFSKYYEIRTKLGEGSYAKVYSCSHVKKEDEICAAKIIKKAIFSQKPHHKVF